MSMNHMKTGRQHRESRQTAPWPFGSLLGGALRSGRGRTRQAGQPRLALAVLQALKAQQVLQLVQARNQSSKMTSQARMGSRAARSRQRLQPCSERRCCYCRWG